MILNNEKKKKKNIRIIYFLVILFFYLIKIKTCMINIPNMLIQIPMKKVDKSEVIKFYKKTCVKKDIFLCNKKKRKKEKNIFLFIKYKYIIKKKKNYFNKLKDTNILKVDQKDNTETKNYAEINIGGNKHNNHLKNSEISYTEQDVITKSSELMKYLNFSFDEECNEIMIRIGNFLEVSPHLLFKDVCVNLKKLYTNLYTYDNENIPFGHTEHTLNINDDVIKHNKFKIYCVLGLKVLRIFLIKYLRSIKLCIPVEVRKRYIYDFLKIEYISKIYDKKYNLIDFSVYNNISDKLKAKLIYFYLSLKPQDVPNILIKIFRAANYNDENELLYNYIMNSKFTSRGGKRFRRNITKEYKILFEKDKLKKKHSCENDILWQRFFSLIKEYNAEIANEKKILRDTYRLIFSKINFSNIELIQLFEKKGFYIFDENDKENKNKSEVEIEKEVKSTLKEKLKIGNERKIHIINYINNLRKFIIDYIQRNKSIYHSFYLLKKNINIPKNIYYDDIISKNTNIFHFTNIEDTIKEQKSETNVPDDTNYKNNSNYLNKIPNNSKHEENDKMRATNETIDVEHNGGASKDIHGEKQNNNENINNLDINTNDKKTTSESDISLYCNQIVNNIMDNILDILIENSGFKNIKTLFGIYNSLKNNKEFKLIHFKNKF
ncbi:conserved Plasmodium protein, unknown function [Plasmodium gallinaceum]|uniref:Uncharacterized protein n=1 Tax=Plasmodium gallinaceum TaxID=5849 RepID=A0A1J1GMK2_PLAGA|nr:conserved Plasmodium protein, unknown function [Plasmodium gallinaceum]CRG93563.1 conserved Plasmodium protein, unknown function [Plasmodium gallinaceum]